MGKELIDILGKELICIWCVSLVYFVCVDRYMLFFQMPLIPELLLMAFDLESMDQLAETIKNNKPTAEDVEAYKYNFSSKGKNNKPTAEDVEAYKYNFTSKGINSACWVFFIMLLLSSADFFQN